MFLAWPLIMIYLLTFLSFSAVCVNFGFDGNNLKCRGYILMENIFMIPLHYYFIYISLNLIGQSGFVVGWQAGLSGGSGLK